jgi:hypothetical protein
VCDVLFKAYTAGRQQSLRALLPPLAQDHLVVWEPAFWMCARSVGSKPLGTAIVVVVVLNSIWAFAPWRWFWIMSNFIPCFRAVEMLDSLATV